MRPTPVNVHRWLEGKSIEDFGAIEHGRKLLFPDCFVRFSAKGERIEEPVLIRVPGPVENDQGPIDAVNLVAKLRKDSEIKTVDAARAAIGAVRYEVLETLAIVALCAHEVDPPHAQFMLLDVLRKSYLEASIFDVWKHMDLLNGILNPCLDGLTEDQFWGAIAVIAEKQSISPLGGMRGDTQLAFLVRAATELWALRTQSSSSSSAETSTAES